jgi:hypothetical protein
LFKYFIATLQILIALSSFSYTPKANSFEDIQVITDYGNRYQLDYLWDWMGYHYSYPYNHFLDYLNIDAEIALLRVCNTVNDNKPDECDDKPANIDRPRTKGCSYSPDYSFLSACNRYDVCYDSLGTSKSSCDSTFKSDMKRICNIEYTGRFGRIVCSGAVNAYYSGVVIAGDGAYYDSQVEAAWWATHESTYGKI